MLLLLFSQGFKGVRGPAWVDRTERGDAVRTLRIGYLGATARASGGGAVAGSPSQQAVASAVPGGVRAGAPAVAVRATALTPSSSATATLPKIRVRQPSVALVPRVRVARVIRASVNTGSARAVHVARAVATSTPPKGTVAVAPSAGWLAEHATPDPAPHVRREDVEVESDV